MKTLRDYINENSFKDVWTAIVKIFEESEEVKPVYAEYYEKLKNLPFNPKKEDIKFVNPYGQTKYYHLGEQPLGMNGAPEHIIDKNIYLGDAKLESREITAILMYWASLHSYMTSKEHDDDLLEYLKIITEDKTGRGLCEYLYREEPFSDIKEESLEKKQARFWKDRTDMISSGDWRGILMALKSGLEFNIGFMRGFADHSGREHDADRMQLCCNLIDIATKNIYPDARGKKALRILFAILTKEIYSWVD